MSPKSVHVVVMSYMPNLTYLSFGNISKEVPASWDLDSMLPNRDDTVR